MEQKAGEPNNEDLLSSSGVTSNGGKYSLSDKMGKELELSSPHSIHSGCRVVTNKHTVLLKFYFLGKK